MLYGIRKIEYCNAANLAFSDIFSTYIETCTPTNSFNELCIVQQKAKLKIESDIENKQVIYRTELQFDTEKNPAIEKGNFAFKVTTVNGEQFLIGCPSRPRVVVTTAHNVAESASGQSGYTNICKFTALYKPKTIPNTAEPISDLRQFDICCGQIAQPQQPDTREFDICCGEIEGEAEPTLLTVVWLNGDGSVLDTKHYYSNQPEPTTTAVPLKAATSEYSYTFDHWQVLSNVGNVKTYEPIFTAVPLTILVYFTYSGSGPMKYAYKNANGSTTVKTEAYSGISDNWPLYFLAEHYFKFKDTEECTYLTADWTAFNAAFPQMHPIYHPNNPNFQIGYYSDDWQGSI